MTPIEEEIEKLADEHAGNFEYEDERKAKQRLVDFGRELIPLIREECAKIADDAVQLSRSDIGYNLACQRIAAAIREGK